MYIFWIYREIPFKLYLFDLINYTGGHDFCNIAQSIIIIIEKIFIKP